MVSGDSVDALRALSVSDAWRCQVVRGASCAELLFQLFVKQFLGVAHLLAEGIISIILTRQKVHVLLMDALIRYILPKCSAWIFLQVQIHLLIEVQTIVFFVYFQVQDYIVRDGTQVQEDGDQIGLQLVVPFDVVTIMEVHVAVFDMGANEGKVVDVLINELDIVEWNVLDLTGAADAASDPSKQ